MSSNKIQVPIFSAKLFVFSKIDRDSEIETCTFGEKEQEGEGKKKKKGKLKMIKPNLSRAEASSLCCFFCICSHHRFKKNWKKNQENSGSENIAKKQASLGRCQLAVGMSNSCWCPLIR